MNFVDFDKLCLWCLNFVDSDKIYRLLQHFADVVSGDHSFVLFCLWRLTVSCSLSLAANVA